MDVILHVGAHRTATTGFQNYLRGQGDALQQAGIGFWGPWRTRGRLLHGVGQKPVSPKVDQRVRGRIRMALEQAANTGAHSLLVSDENLIGSMRRNLRNGALYPDLGARMARVQDGFGPVKRIVFQIRSLDRWWGSALAYLVPRGEAVPQTRTLDRISGNDRSWRHAITELAAAFPDADIVVTPFERFAQNPQELAAVALQSGGIPSAGRTVPRCNAAPDLPALRDCLVDRGDFPDALPDGPGRWQPFTPFQVSSLRETYADDLFWLRAGADGLARFIEDPQPAKPVFKTVAGVTKRGHTHDRSARRLEKSR